VESGAASGATGTVMDPSARPPPDPGPAGAAVFTAAFTLGKQP